MKNKSIKGVILFILILFFAFFGYQLTSKINHKNKVAQNIKTLPTFVYENINGTVFTQKNLKSNTPILFIYFNSECDFCNEEAQMIRENKKKLENIQVIFISFERPELIKRFALEHQLTDYENITFLYDRKVTFSTTFDTKSMPSLILYDKNQKLIEKIKGQTKIETIIKRLNSE